MNGRKNPESGIGPEFIRVIYDEKGNPIAVKPADGSVLQDKKSSDGSTNGGSPRPTFPTLPTLIPQPVEQWLTLISKNILSLKADIERTQNSYNQIIAEVKQINTTNIANTANTKEISTPDISPIIQQINDQKIMYKLLADQINVMNEIISTIAKEVAQQKTLSKDFYEVMNGKMKQLNEKLNESLSDNFSSIKTIETELDSIRNDSMQRFSFIDDKVSAMHRQLAASDERTEGDLIVMNDVSAVMNERIAELNEKIDSIQSIKQEFEKMIEQNAEKNKIDRQILIEEVVDRVSKRMKNLVAKRVEVQIKVKRRKSRKVKARKVKKVVKNVVKKKRKVVRKITRAKISKNLIVRKLKKSEIENYGSALVVTERKAQKYGRAVFDVARKLNGNVVMIMQEKMSEDDGFEPITYDAIDNSEAVFIVTNRKMKKNFAVRNAALKRRVFLVNKNLNFSEVKY